jgi:putative addiction module component (TIGR02574 family)
MPVTFASLGMENLTPKEKMDVLQDLSSEIAEDADGSGLSEDVKRMLDQRIAEADANPDAGIPWEVVMREVREKYGW